MLELQRKLLGDKIRNEAFHAALKSAIKPSESVVLDVGSGTGFLSFLAERLGAKECWLVESGDVGMLAEDIAKLNGMTRCRFVHAYSSDVPLPPADVIVSETLGNYALEEGIINTMSHARGYLREGGAIIPRSLRQFACPVVSRRLHDEIDVWDVGYGLDMEPARRVSLQNMYVKTIVEEDLLEGGKAAKAWDALDFGEDNDNLRKATVEWTPATETTVNGVALWWDATLAPGIVLSTSPLAKATHWEQIYLPLACPISVAAGQTMRLSLESDTSPDVRIRLRWRLWTDTEPSDWLDTNEGLL